MRGRLLDMGELEALRSRSVFCAIAATMRPGDPPAVVLSAVGGELRLQIVASQALPGVEKVAHLERFESSVIGVAVCFAGSSRRDHAEALVVSVESECGLELIPSMPTPEEMQAVYEWDRKLSAGDQAWTKEASSCS